MAQHKPKMFYRNMTRQKADRIRVLYFERKWRQQQIATLFDIKQNTVSRIVSGQVWTA